MKYYYYRCFSQLLSFSLLWLALKHAQGLLFSMDRGVFLVLQTAIAHSRIHVHLAYQDIPMMLSFKTAYNALQLVIQSTLDAMNAATKFKAQGLFVHHVHLETMFFKREANASR